MSEISSRLAVHEWIEDYLNEIKWPREGVSELVSGIASVQSAVSDARGMQGNLRAIHSQLQTGLGIIDGVRKRQPLDDRLSRYAVWISAVGRHLSHQIEEHIDTTVITKPV
jgi:hypothetical protein